MRLPYLVRYVTLVALAMMGWLLSATVWAADAPLCHEDGKSAQGQEPVLIADEGAFGICDQAPVRASDEKAPAPYEKRQSRKADEAILTGWVWFPRVLVSDIDYVIETPAGNDGERNRVDRPPRVL